MIEYVVAALLIFWMIPWAVCHGYVVWWLRKNGTAKGGYAAFLGMLLVFGVIPIVNFILMFKVFILPWISRRTG
jgi:hypothetical protein